MSLLDLQGMEIAHNPHGGGNPPPSLISIQYCDFMSSLSLTLCF
jgi:hypothetical protein